MRSTKLKDSRFFEPLLDRYWRSPSIALCRVPELELLADVELRSPVLDHCCGDGFIAGSAFPETLIDVGVDFSEKQLERAKERANYRQLVSADCGKELPFPSESFMTVFNNSGMEHIISLDTAIKEIARVLKPGGTLIFNLLSKRFYERWPLSSKEMDSYRAYQPIHHALSEEEWRSVLGKHGFSRVEFADYFDERMGKYLAKLDYQYSSFFINKNINTEVLTGILLPKPIAKMRWRSKLGDMTWGASVQDGSGFRITAIKSL